MFDRFRIELILPLELIMLETRICSFWFENWFLRELI